MYSPFARRDSLVPILISRFFFNLRSIDHGPDTELKASQMTSIRFPSIVMGNIGAALDVGDEVSEWHSSEGTAALSVDAPEDGLSAIEMTRVLSSPEPPSSAGRIAASDVVASGHDHDDITLTVSRISPSMPRGDAMLTGSVRSTVRCRGANDLDSDGVVYSIVAIVILEQREGNRNRFISTL